MFLCIRYGIRFGCLLFLLLFFFYFVLFVLLYILLNYVFLEAVNIPSSHFKEAKYSSQSKSVLKRSVNSKRLCLLNNSITH